MFIYINNFPNRTDINSPKIVVYHVQGTTEPLHVEEKLHTKPVTTIKYNTTYGVVISIDKAGILEYWTGLKDNFKFPSKIVNFESKLDTGKILSPLDHQPST